MWHSVSDTDLQAQPLHEVLQELKTFAIVAGLSYDENMQMESVQCYDDLEGNWGGLASGR